MAVFHLPEKAVVRVAGPAGDPCLRYAADETVRLLARLGCAVRRQTGPSSRSSAIEVFAEGGRAPSAPLPAAVKGDGYALTIAPAGAAIAAREPKGVLNGVYDFAERLGFTFLSPGEAGEIPPAAAGAGAACGSFTAVPRFRHRGVYAHSIVGKDASGARDWLAFYAKLRMNAVGADVSILPLCREFGLRLETGGHGLTELVPRDLFKKDPDLFRMPQPEDFFGKRQNDYNACPSHPGIRRIIKERFKEKMRTLEGVHAHHLWPEDLPGGGWCLCSRCRALSPSDQALLAMRYLAETVAEQRLSARVPMLVYHDTIAPPTMLKPRRELFLLYAPRERCYGHALDDASCPRNRFYLASLKAWAEAFAGISDGHTFEYYCDQVLFRGMYPFLPEVILDDMRVYETHGIESHMVLQVGGASIPPEHNLLLFARAAWDRRLTADKFIRETAGRVSPAQPAEWESFLRRRGDVFQRSMRMCAYDPAIYLDYRWLPETTGAFGREMARTYRSSARLLEALGGGLVRSAGADAPKHLRALAEAEYLRSRYEAAELVVMAFQQDAANALGSYYGTGAEIRLEQALDALKQARAALGDAKKRAKEARLPESYYFFSLKNWLDKEFAGRIAVFSKA